MNTFTAYQEAVQQSVQSVADEFRRSPESFLYESDLQARLFARLFDALAGVQIRRAADSDWLSVCGRDVLALNPVKTEYPDTTRFDIAVLDPVTDPAENIWNQPVRLALELKFRQANGGGPTVTEDIAKLKRYQSARGGEFTGISLLFCHRSDDAEPRSLQERIGLELNPSVLAPVYGVVAWGVTTVRTR